MLKGMKPVLSEKCRMLSEKESTYMIEVTGKTSKQEIAEAVAKEFKDVKVANVRTVVRNGKRARAARGKNRYPLAIVRSDRKFAYIKLSEGKLPFFEDPEDKKKAKKADDKVVDKKAAKKAKKESK